MKPKYKYLVSYVSKSGVVTLNLVIEGTSSIDAMFEIKEDVRMILSCVPIEY
jgi:hypothetical protein